MYYASKAVVLSAALIYMKYRPTHYLPTAIVAFAASVSFDYAMYLYTYQHLNKYLVKYTGFDGLIYISPDKYAIMK